jgi:hypothetical protein
MVHLYGTRRSTLRAASLDISDLANALALDEAKLNGGDTFALVDVVLPAGGTGGQRTIPLCSSGSIPIPCVPHVLRHILNPAEKGDDEGAFCNLPNPPAVLQGPFVCAPIIHEGLLRQEGLLDVHRPALLIAQPCVFKPSRWATGHLLAKEWLRTFDSPLSFDPVFLDNSRVRELLRRCLSPSIISVIFGALWSDHTGGVQRGDILSASRLPLEPKRETRVFDKKKGMEEKFTGMDSREEGPEALASPRCKDTPVESKVPPACNARRLPSAAQNMVLAPEEAEEADGENERLYRIKREHNLAKAVKSDDAAVNVRVWDEAIFRDCPLSEQLEMAATWLRGKCLLKYRRGLVRDIGHFLARSYGGIPGKNYETRKGPSNHTIQVEDLKGYKGWASLMPA